MKRRNHQHLHQKKEKEEKKFKVEIGPPRLTKFEKVKILATRALQISMGSPIFIKLPPGVTRPLDIAELELKKGVLPFIVRRKLPDGTSQDIPIQYLKDEETY